MSTTDTYKMIGVFLAGALLLDIIRKKKYLGFEYPGAIELFSRKGKRGLRSKKQTIRAKARKGLMTRADAKLYIHDLEHDWFHYKKDRGLEGLRLSRRRH